MKNRGIWTLAEIPKSQHKSKAYTALYLSLFSLIIIFGFAAGYVYINNQIQPIIPLMNQSHNSSNTTNDSTKQSPTTFNSKTIINSNNTVNITSDQTPSQTTTSNKSSTQKLDGNGAIIPINYDAS